MDVATFVRKWSLSSQKESAASQEHFIDLCRLLGEQTPNDADPSGDFYAFEKGAERTTGNDGFADVWYKGHFGWEYKGKHKDLRAAYKQLLDYHEALEQPPLLVVSDMERFEVHTKWTSTESWVYEFALPDLASDSAVRIRTINGDVDDGPKLSALDVLRALFQDPDRLKPGRTTDAITQEAAKRFHEIATTLRKWPDVEDMQIARFVSRLVFCMFASDVGLLDRGTFSEVVKRHRDDPKAFREALGDLFKRMARGGRYGAIEIKHFNGDLFDDDQVPDHLTYNEVRTLEELDRLNWADVEPAIFGTLFERVLKPDARARLGAHYTSRTDIELIVEPVLMDPLRREWRAARQRALDAMTAAAERGATAATQRERLRAEVQPVVDRLASIRVLDPACGSGNFLYVALALLKGLEKEIVAFADLHGVALPERVHPRQLFGIELDPYAHELASIVIWIGYLQWKYRHAMRLDDEEPVLQRLDQVKLMDAIVDRSDPRRPVEPEWPESDVVVGNPPFLGGKRLRKELTDEYVDAMFAVWDGRVRRESDLCCYWFEKARAAIEAGRVQRAGLLATQAIRGGANRETLRRIKETGNIFFAVDDREWVLDGAAVQVSMVGFDNGTETRRVLLQHYESREPEAVGGRRRRRRIRFRDVPVEGINSNLTALINVGRAIALEENKGISFMGTSKIGAFDIDESQAMVLLGSPNPDGRSNSDVVRPWANGDDLLGTRRERTTGERKRMWIIDFPPETSEQEAAMYEAPYEYVRKHVFPKRSTNRRSSYALRWWLHGEPRPAMRIATEGLQRYVCTPRVSKYRLFVWLRRPTLPDSATFVFARDDDYFFGVLQSRSHELWALAQGTQLENRPRYTPTSCFETFPLPWRPGWEPWGDPRLEAIVEAARELNELREEWLNPKVPAGEKIDPPLARRTLTNLYNQRPTWLANAHRRLDEAVLAAYGWPSDLSDLEVLERLLALNLERAGDANS